MKDIVACEVCALPHRRGVSVCEDCGHPIGLAPNWNILRRELADLKVRIWIGVASIAGMIALNALLFGGAGYILAVAPFGWVVLSANRYRAIAKRLPPEGSADERRP